jgi:hypothetical protein
MMLDLSQLPENALQAITGDELHRSTELFNVVKQLRLRLTNITEEILDRSYTQHVQVNCVFFVFPLLCLTTQHCSKLPDLTYYFFCSTYIPERILPAGEEIERN